MSGNVTMHQNGKVVIGKEWRFEIDKPMGYVRTTQRAKFVDPNYKRYQEYKTTVRLLANSEGVPSEIQEGCRAEVEVFANYPNEKHPDLDNIIKGVLDGLWRQDNRVVKLWGELSIDPLSGAKAHVVVRFLRVR